MSAVRGSRFCASILAAIILSPAHAEDPVRRFSLPAHGNFELRVPNAWKDSVRQPPNGLPPTITFRSTGSARFEIIVTPIWPMRPDIKTPTVPELKANVREAADRIAPQAVEQTIEVRELRAASSTVGYYYTVTDKAPKLGEYKLMTQGMLGVKDLRVSFTVLTNEGQESTIRQALAMLSSATHSPL